VSALNLRTTFRPATPLPVSHKARLGAEVLAAYARSRRSLARNGLAPTLAAIRSTSIRSELVVGDRYAAYRLGRLVQSILRFLPDARCLTRSVVLVDLLSKRGVHTSLVIGVTPGTTFAAHAWVELDGVALLPAFESEFRRLTEL
jgi:hypothetical protein